VLKDATIVDAIHDEEVALNSIADSNADDKNAPG
jgi:hypothetical protein